MDPKLFILAPAWLAQPGTKELQNETANRGCHVRGASGTCDVVFARDGPTKDCKGMSGRMARQ
jgi:hypothetical protein